MPTPKPTEPRTQKPEARSRDALRVIGSRAAVQIPPGAKVAPAPLEAMPQFAIARWEAQGGNLYAAVVRPWPQWVPVNGQLLRAVNKPRKTFLRLLEAGLVKSRRPTPHTREVEVESLVAYLEGCQDPEYWETVVQWPDGRRMTRLARFREAI